MIFKRKIQIIENTVIENDLAILIIVYWHKIKHNLQWRKNKSHLKSMHKMELKRNNTKLAALQMNGAYIFIYYSIPKGMKKRT